MRRRRFLACRLPAHRLPWSGVASTQGDSDRSYPRNPAGVTPAPHLPEWRLWPPVPTSKLLRRSMGEVRGVNKSARIFFRSNEINGLAKTSFHTPGPKAAPGQHVSCALRLIRWPTPLEFGASRPAHIGFRYGRHQPAASPSRPLGGRRDFFVNGFVSDAGPRRFRCSLQRLGISEFTLGLLILSSAPARSRHGLGRHLIPKHGSKTVTAPASPSRCFGLLLVALAPMSASRLSPCISSAARSARWTSR